MGQFGIGQSVTRIEDLRLLTGGGRYTDDVQLDGESFAFVLRSPHAHAGLGRIDTDAAKAAPGVLAVLTGEDLAADKVNGLPCGWLIHSIDGSPMKEPPHPVIAQGKVRHVGDQVALVVAESVALATFLSRNLMFSTEKLAQNNHGKSQPPSLGPSH